jgi:hypothetical protein
MVTELEESAMVKPKSAIAHATLITALLKVLLRFSSDIL